MRSDSRLVRPTAVAALVCGIVFGPFAAGFATAQDSVADLRQEREDNRRAAAEVAAELDALTAQDEELLVAIEALEANIALQQGRVDAAQRSIDDAEARAAAARAQATALGDDMDAIRERLRLRAVDVFVAPRFDVLDQLNNPDLLEGELKQSYLDEWVGDERQLIDQLRAAQAAQDTAEQVAQEAVAEAERERGAQAEALKELDANRAEVEGLRAEVAGRIDEWEAAGAEIDAADAALEQEIRQLEAELARQAAAAEEARREAEEAARRQAEEAAAAGEDPVEDVDDPPANLGPFSVVSRPVPGRITSGFGSRVHPIFGSRRNHYGVDLNGSSGDPIVAAADGTVLCVGWMSGYGNVVVISHGDGYSTLYAHQSELLVSAGATVSSGTVIGRVGSTGYSTGPHLHFEIRVNGSAIDPAPYL